MHTYTHAHKITPVFTGWDHTQDKETYLLITYFMDQYRGFVSVLLGFFSLNR